MRTGFRCVVVTIVLLLAVAATAHGSDYFAVRDGADGRRLNPTRRILRAVNGWSGGWRSPQWPTAFGPTFPASPAERAADASSWCGVTPRSQWATFDVTMIGRDTGDYGWRPTSAQFVATCRALLRGW